MNIFSIGYPKSGTSWVKRLLIDTIPRGVERTGEYERSTDQSYQIWKRHWSVKEANRHGIDFSKIIFIVRDVRDIIISAMGYFDIDTIDGAIDNISKGDFISAAIGELLPWNRYVEEWLGASAYVVRYKDLLTNDIRETTKILQYLGVEALSEDVRLAVINNRFDNKKEALLKNFRKTHDVNDLYDYNFLRVGKTGQYKTKLNDYHLEIITKLFGDTMLKLGYNI